MYTPQEVSEKTFPKTSRGYNMAAVDEFLDGLTEDYTSLYKDNVTLRNKLKLLAEKVEEYRATEDAMRSTLLAAQKMAAQMVAEAQAEKEKMLQEARGEAEEQARQLQEEVRSCQAKLLLAQQQTAEFIRRSQELCAQQAAFLESLPERELPEEEREEPAAVQEEDNWTKGLWGDEEPAPAREETPAPQQEEPQPEPEAEGTETASEEESSFATDFRMSLSLEDLQFGRNYNGGKN